MSCYAPSIFFVLGLNQGKSNIPLTVVLKKKLVATSAAQVSSAIKQDFGGRVRDSAERLRAFTPSAFVTIPTPM